MAMTRSVSAAAVVLTAGLAQGHVNVTGASVHAQASAQATGHATEHASGQSARVAVPAAVRGAFALSADDVARIGATPVRGYDFSVHERPGEVERSDMVFVEMRDARSMGEQIVRDSIAGEGRAVRTPGALRERIDARQARALERLRPSLHDSFEDLGGHRVLVPEGVTEEELAEALMATGDYASVTPDWTCYPLDTTPNDSQFGNQYHHGPNHLNTVGAWDMVTGSGSVIIAVGDTGVDLDHPDLQAALLPGYNAVDRLTAAEGGQIGDINGHGSGAIGCAAAIGNNGIGVAGMGWNFSILPIRVTNNSGGGAAISVLKHAANWAADNGASSISISYSGVETAGNVGTSVQQDGATLFWSSGNDGIELLNPVRDTIAVVGALSTNGQRASFSNYGDPIDIMAHGVSVRSTNRFGGYTWFGGTSAAAPLANGAAGLLYTANPDLHPTQIRAIMYDTATDLGSPGWDEFNGWGRINCEDAVVAALTGDFSTPLPLDDSFDDGALSMGYWTDVTGAGVNGDGINEPSAPDSLNISGTDTASTVRLAPDGAGAGTGVSFFVQDIGVEAGETLVVEYFDGSWNTLFEVVSDGQTLEEYTWAGALLPVPALTDDLRIRVTGAGDSADDDWYIDDLLVAEDMTVTAPFLESFLSPVDTDLVWSVFEGAESGGFVTLSGTDTIETHAIDTSAYMDGTPAYLSFEYDGTDAGVNDLELEVRNAAGIWQPAGAFTSGSPYQLAEVPLDPAWLGTDFALRLSSQTTEPLGWAIRDIYIGGLSFVSACSPADIDADGDVDPDDISAFVDAFTDGTPDNADIDNDGDEDPDDISAFVDAFIAGC